jgi:hypothetical protein
MGNDVVLLRLNAPLAFSEKVMPICLPQEGANINRQDF